MLLVNEYYRKRNLLRICVVIKKKKYLICLNCLLIDNLIILRQVDNYLKVKFISDEDGGINVKYIEKKFNVFYQVVF